MMLAEVLCAWPDDQLKRRLELEDEEVKRERPELVAKVCAKILDKRRIVGVLHTCTDAEMARFDALCAEPLHSPDYYIPDDVGFLVRSDLCFLDEKGDIFVPEDVQACVRAALTPEVERKRQENQEIFLYIRGLSSLFGVVPLEKVISIFNAHHARMVDGILLRGFLENSARDDICCWLDGDILVHEALDEDDEEEMYRIGKGIEYYNPGHEEVLHWADEDYIEWTEPLKALEAFFRARLQMSEKDAQAAAIDTQNGIHIDCNLEDLMDSPIAPLSLNHPLEILDDYVEVLEAVRLQTRIWSLKGHKPAELPGKMPARASFKVQWKSISHFLKPKPPGRNDPCPCGSGLKYKRCCGR